MRTFHIGGTASRVNEQSSLDAKHAGTVRYQGLQVVETKPRPAPARRQGRARRHEPHRVDRHPGRKGRDRERYPIVYGARLKVRDGQQVEQGTILVEWDPYTFSILTEDAGTVKYKDLIPDVTITRKWTRSPACRGRSSWTAPTRRSSRRSRSATRRAR